MNEEISKHIQIREVLGLEGIEGEIISLIKENKEEFKVFMSGGSSSASRGTSETFLDLTDTPSTYSGNNDKLVSVKSDGSGLEFIVNSGGHNPITLDVNADTILSLSTQELGLDTQGANTIFAGPASGADAVPTFRALVADDIPDLSGTYLTAETDPDFNAWLLATPPLYPGGWYDAVQNTIGLSGFDNDSGFITSFDDEKVKYDAGDPTAGYVADKIIAGTGISVAEGTGANENKLVVTSDITQYTDEMAQDAVGNALGAGLAYNDTTGAISVDATLDEIGNPATSKTFTMGGNTITWNFTNPVGGMLFNLTGGWSGHVLEVMDTSSTPNGAAGDHLMHLETSRVNVVSAHFVNNAVNGVGLKVDGLTQLNGDTAITGDITATNLSGTNTGDQDLSGYLKLDATNYDSVIFPDGKYVGIDQIRARDGDGLKLTDDGNNGIFIKDGGNVGIGTVTPSRKLHVYSAELVSAIFERNLSADVGIQLKNPDFNWAFGFDDSQETFSIAEASDLNSGSQHFVIKSGGNVGIGTTNPLANLDIKTAGGFTRGLKIGPQTTDTGDGSYIEFITSNVDGYGPQIGGIRTGSDGIGDLIIKTGGNSQQERMRITNTGNVGAGVTPVVKLDVAGSATNGKSLQLRSGDGATGTDSNQIIFTYNNNPYNSGGYAHAIKTTHDNASAAGNTISFWLRNHGTDDANTIGTKKVLELNGAGLVYAPTKIQVGSASSALTGEVLKGAYNGVTVSSPIGVGIENTGTSGSGQGAGSVWYSNDGAAMASGDRLGFLLFGGSSSSSALRNTGGISAYATQNWTDGSAYGTKISIETVDNNATSRTETVSFRGTLAYFSGEVSAFSFTDRTPSYEGNALEALSKIKSKDGQIDHSTLPKEARVIKEVSKNIYEKGVMVGQEIVEEEGRDLGMMISILTKAVQQLRSEINILKGAKEEKKNK